MIERIKEENEDNWIVDSDGRPLYQIDILCEHYEPVCFWGKVKIFAREFRKIIKKILILR